MNIEITSLNSGQTTTPIQVSFFSSSVNEPESCATKAAKLKRVKTPIGLC